MLVIDFMQAQPSLSKDYGKEELRASKRDYEVRCFDDAPVHAHTANPVLTCVRDRRISPFCSWPVPFACLCFD